MKNRLDFRNTSQKNLRHDRVAEIPDSFYALVIYDVDWIKMDKS